MGEISLEERFANEPGPYKAQSAIDLYRPVCNCRHQCFLGGLSKAD
jgi:hypothetical protein